MHVYVCIYVCMYVCMYACIRQCIYMSVYNNIKTYTCKKQKKDSYVPIIFHLNPFVLHGLKFVLSEAISGLSMYQADI